MQFRIKAKYWSMNDLTADNYDPKAWVLPGSQAWKMRLAVNEHYKAGRKAEYEASKSELIAHLNRTNRTKNGNETKKGKDTKKAHGPVSLTLELRHGDMVVMHGERIQKIYEVCISSHLHRAQLIPFSMASSQRTSYDLDLLAGT